MSEPLTLRPGKKTPLEPPLAGRMVGTTHVYPLRIFYEDTDAAGIVYYANYLKFAERARTELMRLQDISHSVLESEYGIAFIVRRCEVDYRLPARLDDFLEVHTRIVSLKQATIEAEQIVKRDDVELVRIRLRLACIDHSGRPVRFPGAVREAFVSLQH